MLEALNIFHFPNQHLNIWLGNKIDKIWTSDELCKSDDTFFVASGVCSGWIPGVKFDGEKVIVTSKIIFGDSKKDLIITNEYVNGEKNV